ncbi:MAG: hypothetical protein KAV00_03525 [Phycisphaerae bacterium]|nr:hypothetical protein [Phycisphaerae bacterium]
MDTERNQDPAEPTGCARTSKTNTHWGEWEIGCLLNQLRDGWKLGPIAVDLHRTEAACKRMLARLVDGETPCPKQYKSLFEEVRERFPAESKRHAHPKSPGQCREEIRQQYQALDDNIDTIRKLIIATDQTLSYILALDIIDGRITFNEVYHHCPNIISRITKDMVNRIKTFRKEHADLFNKPPAPQGDGCRPPTPGNPHPQSVIADPETGSPAPTEDKA